MATQSSGESVFGAMLPPLRGTSAMDYQPLPTLGGTTTATTFTPTTYSTAGNVTYTVADLLGYLILRDPASAPRSDVTPTAALIVAALPGAKLGQSFQFVIVNTSGGANTITLTAGTGVTIAGTATIAQNNAKEFLAYVTNATKGSEAVTVRSLGTFVF